MIVVMVVAVVVVTVTGSQDWGGGLKISNIIKKKKVKWHGEFFVALVDCYSKITPLSLSDLKLSPGFRGI